MGGGKSAVEATLPVPLGSLAGQAMYTVSDDETSGSLRRFVNGSS